MGDKRKREGEQKVVGNRGQGGGKEKRGRRGRGNA